MAKEKRHTTPDFSSLNVSDPTPAHKPDANMVKSVNLIINSHPEELKQLRKVMMDVLLKARISKQKAQLITLAVNEGCSNVIKYGYKNDYNQKIKITISIQTDIFTITIIDTGIKFDINAIEPRDVREVKPGGLGPHIMQEVMDIVEYSRTLQNSNQLTMVKKLLS